MDNISIITTHFYDFDWMRVWAKKIHENTEAWKIKEVLIINQDRCEDSRRLLEEIYQRARIPQYPRNEEQFVHRGHDHAAVLNLAIGEATGEYICLFDSDCHPFSKNWLSICEEILQSHDAIVAFDQFRFLVYSMQLSHPCFMVLRSEHVTIPLLFDAGFPQKRYDTGRLIGRQLEEAGNKVFYAKPSGCFRNFYGEIYLDSIYHHGQGSYAGGDDRLSRQIGYRHRFFKNVVVKKGKYNINDFEYLQFKAAAVKNYGYMKYLSEIPAKLLGKLFHNHQHNKE